MYGFSGYSLMGFLLGFMLGVGCALAVMYGIYMGGYRAALRDARQVPPSKRYRDETARLRDQKSSPPLTTPRH